MDSDVAVEQPDCSFNILAGIIKDKETTDVFNFGRGNYIRGGGSLTHIWVKYKNQNKADKKSLRNSLKKDKTSHKSFYFFRCAVVGQGDMTAEFLWLVGMRDKKEHL